MISEHYFTDVASHQPSETYLPHSDEELAAVAARVGETDEAAFAELLHRHHHRVARIARRFFSKPDEIEEISQLSFIEAWRAIGSYESRPDASFAAWLTRITINTCYDEWRRRRRSRESAFSDLNEAEAVFLSAQSVAPSLGVRVERELISRDLATKLLAMLDPDDRRVFVLLKAEDHSIAEIALATGWTPAKVKMRVHRTKSLLRRKSRRLI
jgi:RNA polymerase sigma factor (sigma-70 family)